VAKKPPEQLPLPDDVKAGVQKVMEMGLGEAIRRLMRVELMRQTAISAVPEMLAAERDMLIAALNTIKMDLGFDCNEDGVPDTVEIFARSVATSCCRLVPIDTSRSKPVATSRRVISPTAAPVSAEAAPEEVAPKISSPRSSRRKKPDPTPEKP
jgi:hypothetical protein